METRSILAGVSLACMAMLGCGVQPEAPQAHGAATRPAVAPSATLPAARPSLRSATASPARGPHGPVPGSAEAWGREFDRAMRSHLEARAATGDDHARLLLALMVRPDDVRFDGDPEAWAKARAEALREVAAALPDDPLVAWLEAQACGPGMGCDRLSALERLAALDPGNAAVWWALADEARRWKDPAAVDHFLALAAASERVSMPGGTLGPVYADVLGGMIAPPLDPALRAQAVSELGLSGLPADIDVVLLYGAVYAGLMEAVFSPNLVSVSQLCGAPASPSRRASCRANMELLASGDSLLMQRMGLTMLVRATEGSPRAAVWRERLRQHYWTQELALRQGWFNDPRFVILRAYDGEIAALERYMRLNGFSDPPEGWLPRDPGQRALVTGNAEAAG